MMAAERCFFAEAVLRRKFVMTETAVHRIATPRYAGMMTAAARAEDVLGLILAMPQGNVTAHPTRRTGMERPARNAAVRVMMTVVTGPLIAGPVSLGNV